MIYLTYLSQAKPTNDNKEFDKNQLEAFDRRVTKKIQENELIVSEKCSISITNFKTALDAAMLIYPVETDLRNEYTIFNIPKRSGGVREIWAPSDTLKAVCRSLLDMIDRDLKFLPHNAAHGFTHHRNTKTCLTVHQKQSSRWFMKLDMSNFFPSFNVDDTVNLMKCVYPFNLLGENYLQQLVHLASVDGKLVQGNPLTPMLTNIAMVSVDDKLDHFARKKGLTYTRYADDMQISSKYDFSGVMEGIQTSIADLLPPFLSINCEKTRYGSFAGRNWNLGLMYNNKYEITVGHARYHWCKVGVHKLEVDEDVDVAQLGGVLAYCRYIEHNKYEPLWQRYLAAKA